MAELDGFLAGESSDAEPGTPGRPGKLLRLGDLTAREAEVLDLVARGLDNSAIASQLGVSTKTLRNHITSIFSKLDVASRAQAIVRARDAGLGQG